MKTINLFVVWFMVLTSAKLLNLSELSWVECFIPVLAYFVLTFIVIPLQYVFINYIATRTSDKNKFEDFLCGKDLKV